MSVRTRNDTATFATSCLDGTEHRFTISLDGTVTNPHHDPEEDAVIEALGGALHPCGTLGRAYTAARVCFDALTGTHDVPGLKKTQRRGWTDGTTCPSCTRDARHLATPVHQAARLGTDRHATLTLLRWLTRRNRVLNPDLHVNPIRASWRTTSDGLQEAFGDSPGVSSQLVSFRSLMLDSLVTPRYVSIAREIVGGSPKAVATLRNTGVRVEWADELLRRTQPRALRYAREHNSLLPTSIGAARNVPAREVARYLNAGVTAHFHTYYTRQVTPQQVIAVYKATNGATTLADLLGTYTVREALHLVGVSQ